MVKRLFFLWVALIMATLAYGQPMDWGQEGYGPHRGRSDLGELPTAFSGGKGDSLNVRCVGRWPYGPAYAVAVQGGYAYLGSGGGIYILDIADPTSPTKIAQIATPGVVHGLFLDDFLLYVGDREAGLRIINVADQANPYEIGYYDTPGWAIGVNVVDTLAYVADWKAGLRVINVADPTNPFEVGYYDTPGSAYGLYLVDSLAYIADGDLRMINVADPANPYEVGYYDTPDWARGVHVVDSLAYVADGGAGLRVINVVDPANPFEVGYYDTPGYVNGGVNVVDTLTYVADCSAGLRVINVADPANPFEVGYYDTPGCAIGVNVANTLAYVADRQAGLRVINVADPANPDGVGYYETPDYASGVYVLGSYAYVADGESGLRIINVTDPANPYEEGYYDTPGYAHGVYTLGSYAYVADYGAGSGLRVINVADPANPYEVGYCETPGWAGDVYVLGSYAYVADEEAGLRIINVTDPANPYEEGYYDTPGYAHGVYVLGSYAYVADYGAGLRVINVSDPASPYEVGYYDTPGRARDVYVLGSYAYVADRDSGLRVINVADPTNPFEVGYYDTPGSAYGLYLVDSLAYIADGDLRMINVADPANPYEVGYYDTPGFPIEVYVVGAYVYVADGFGGLIILQFYGALGTISGTVEDLYTQDPIEGAFVEAMQGESIIDSDNTESDGSYSIPNLPQGTYNVRASKDGYETKTQNGKEVITDQTTTVDFQLNPSPSDTLFFDDFTDGNDDGWQKYGGCTWTVENEEYTSSVSGSEVWCLNAAGNSDWTDYIFEADVYGEGGVDKVVAFRVIDEDNFYAVNVRSDWMGADEVTLSRIVDGVSTVINITDYPSQLNTWYHVKVEVIGDNIKVRVDDNQVIDYTDTDTPLDHGRIAVTAYSGAYGSATVKFDNVLVGRSSEMLGTISGTVEDSYTEEPLGGVLVEAMQGENIIAHENSESDGSYSIPDLPPGTYDVRASKGGYETDTQTGKEVIAGQLTTVDFELLLVFSIQTEFYEFYSSGHNETTDILEIPFQITNNSARAVYSVTVGVYVGGEPIPVDVTQWDIEPQDGKIDVIEPEGEIHLFGNNAPYVEIPPSWEDNEVIAKVEEIEGRSVNFEDSKELSVYYCIGGELSDLHPFRLDPDGYQFPNPYFSDCFEKKVLELGKFSITILPEFTKDFGGHCFGMAASSIAYFVDPDSKPASVREKDTYAMEPGDDGVIPAIVDYHLTQFLHRRFYNIFSGDDPNEAQSSAADLISANQPCIVALRGGGGHAITGYKIIRDESDTDTLSYLYVYDNERPGQSVSPISFDLVEDTFTWPADTDKDKLYIFEPFVIMTTEQMRAEIQEAVKQTAQNLWSKASSRFSSVWQRLRPWKKSRSYTGGNLVRMLITDEFGRRLGFVDGTNFVNEIPGSEVAFLESYSGDTLTADTLTFYDVPKDLNYTVDYFSLDSCFFMAEVLKPESEETALTLGYDSIAVIPNTIATLHVDTLQNYDLEVDYDGDGEIDTTIAPTIANSPPAGFDLLYPVNHDSVSTLTPTLTWASSFDLNGDQIHYRVYIDTDSFFLNPDSSEELLDTSWTVTAPLSDSATYRWKVAAFDSFGLRTWCIEPYWDFVIPYGVGVKQSSPTQRPHSFALLPNYPNPFNPITEIKYALPWDCWVRLEVYNVLGQRVASLVDGQQKAGYKTAKWDAGSLSSGIYFCRLQAGEFVQTRKMVLIR